MNFIKKKYIVYLWRAIVGNCYKIKVWFYLIFGIEPYKKQFVEKRLIISLTSYGRRVVDSAPYAIFSMMNQTCRAEKVILCLDQTIWDNNKLPFLIRKLMHHGLEILYCRDVRSYTKLIPSIQKYPQYTIITVDDDVYYSHRLIETLFKNYQNNPNYIYAVRAYYIKQDKQGNIMPYRNWNPIVGNESHLGNIFPLGCGGILYPPCSLYKDFDKEKLFQTLCPSADDVWFYFMARLKGMRHKYVCNSGCVGYPIDFILQNLNKDALRYHNVSLDNNDEQIEAVLKYYNMHNLNNVNP